MRWLLASTMGAGALSALPQAQAQAQDTGPAAVAAGAGDKAVIATAPAANDPAAQDGQIADILVVARKKSRSERAQDVPIAETALGAQQIAEMHVVTLPDIAAKAPNVTLSNNGTFKGVAAFTIRGLGVNSSIPSIEPAVGTFVDGIYLGTNYGVVLDTFDLESIEILRGPQGTLQGRNVTGGAVLVRSRRPGKDFAVRAQADVETGPQYTFAASVEGPIIRDVLSAKIAGYYKDDKGWFTNRFTQAPAGLEKTWFVRPMATFTPSSTFDLTAIYERGRTRGDGLVVQNAANPSLSRFDLDYNEPGYTRLDWEAITVEANLRVGFGDGVITNLLGRRSVLQDSLTDGDGSPATFFHVFAYLKQKQWSDELRYAGRFGPVDLTAGLFYFEQHYQYIERRLLAGGAVDRSFGGNIRQNSLGLFAQADWHITPTVSATFGLRYSTERKDAKIDPSPTGLGKSNCSYATKSCPFNYLPEFVDGKRWGAWTPKVGLDWKPSGNALIYASWSKGVRDGGYNVRSTSTTVPPGPYEPENQDAFEVGFKTDLADRHVRFNGAAFFNRLSNLQRDVVLVAQPPETGTVQVVRNAVDADIYGVEAELVVAASRSLRLEGSLGYTDAQFRNVRFDLSGDNVIDGNDAALKPPRLSPWTYSVGATFTRPLGDAASWSAHIDFGYRSRAASNDANTTFLRRRDMLNAALTLNLDHDRIELSLYGRNLLDQDWEGSQVLVSTTAPAYTLRGLEKGRVIGLAAKGRF